MSHGPMDQETLSDVLNSKPKKPELPSRDGSINSQAPEKASDCYQSSIRCQFSGLARGRRHLSESHPAGPASVSSPWS